MNDLDSRATVFTHNVYLYIIYILRMSRLSLQVAKAEVEVREAPKQLVIGTGVPGLPRPFAGGGVDQDPATAGPDGVASSPDLAGLTPEALFRSYLEREREANRTVPSEVRAARVSGGPSARTVLRG